MNKLHLIGNAHLDPVCLWRWKDGFPEILNTYRSALDRMKEFSDFVFTSACAGYYEWVETVDPAMFAEIQQRVREGRWCIVGGWFLQPDCNAPCGESFARHALISQRYFLEKLGVMAKNGYNVDSFGHNASLPQILRLSGMENYVFMRPDARENPEIPEIFRWESADGSSVAAYRLRSYGLTEKDLHIFDELKDSATADGHSRMAFYGVGNHGGGPTIRLLSAICARGAADEGFSSPNAYFDSLDKANLPVWKTELQHHARGCYSAVTQIKMANRRCEQNLLAAEAMCTLATRLTDVKYPHKKLQKAWKDLLFNQFHDILGGCSIQSAYKDAAMLHSEILSITEQEIHRAAARITRKIDTLCGRDLPAAKDFSNWYLWDAEPLGTPIVVFNPHAWSVRTAVTLAADAARAIDPDGNATPIQRVRGEQTNGTELYASTFIAEVPAYGYAVYRVFGMGEHTTFTPEVHVDEHTLENSRIRVTFANDGTIAEMFDKAQDKPILVGVPPLVLLDETDCDTWAHGKDSLGETVALFGSASFSVIEAGEVRATLRVTTRYGASTVIQDYTLTNGSDTLTVNMTVDFHEKHRALKLQFPANGNIAAEIPYGSILRQQNTGEEPCGAWLATGALGFASNFVGGYDTENGFVRPTVLRGAIYADHYGQNTRDDRCAYMDMGVGQFTYTLFPFSGAADAARRAAELNTESIVYVDSFHAGEMEQCYSAFSADNANIVVTAIKAAEDENGEILRFYNAVGEDGHAVLSLFGESVECSFHHNEIKTFRTTGEELDLLERNRK